MFDMPTLSSALERFATLRVLCIGDVMLDRFVYGQVDRISPEAPIPVFSIRDERSMLGGAGNVARNLVALGAQTSFLSVVGNDKTGHEIAAMIGKEPRVTPYLITEPGRTSTTKIRYVAASQQVLRADHETQAAISADATRRLIATACEEIGRHDAVILSDYGKGVLSREVIAAIIAAASDAGKPVIVDPKSRDFSMYRGATLVSPNLHELANANARELHGEDDILAAARYLMQAHGIGHILVTRSRDGMTLVPLEGEPHHIPSRAQEVFDVSGAGDTAIATLTLGIASGVPYEQAATLANLAAGIVVGRLGTAVVSTQDIATAMLEGGTAGVMHKVLPLDAAITQVAQWKREGKKIGFTNGCFDLMHPGHLALLQETKSHCDRMIVGLNSDASVKRLKGAGRPVNGEVERAMLLASLIAVDRIVIFEEDTPLALIAALKPDVLAKGADYQKHQVVGHEIVEGYGGKIILVGIKEGYSTTNLIKKMA
jgi:D-beta-D-heptose 7-phosphate kinase/D-beta-D-heptose 1-phosphate adenosyltransferase